MYQVEILFFFQVRKGLFGSSFFFPNPIRLRFSKTWFAWRPFDYWKVHRTLYGGNRWRTCMCLLCRHWYRKFSRVRLQVPLTVNTLQIWGGMLRILLKELDGNFDSIELVFIMVKLFMLLFQLPLEIMYQMDHGQHCAAIHVFNIQIGRYFLFILHIHSKFVFIMVASFILLFPPQEIMYPGQRIGLRTVPVATGSTGGFYR